MSLFSSKPTRAPRPDAEIALYDQAQQQRGTAAAMSPLVRMRLADISDPSNEIRQARATGNADAAQGMGRLTDTGRGTAFRRAMQRGRGLTRIALMGEEAARMQSLRDRATVGGFGQQLLRGQSGSLGGLAQSQAITDASRMQTQQIAHASRANVFGTVLGGIGAGYNNWRSRPVGLDSPDLSSASLGLPAIGDLAISPAEMGLS